MESREMLKHEWRGFPDKPGTHPVSLLLWDDGQLWITAWDGLGGGEDITLEQLRILVADLDCAVRELEDK